ncbi:MAG: hypothetical protein JWN56_2487 [Sphingobacteriales bacterium]|nr:hypothetical protein [Sphingobacteriales bacterium]
MPSIKETSSKTSNLRLINLTIKPNFKMLYRLFAQVTLDTFTNTQNVPYRLFSLFEKGILLFPANMIWGRNNLNGDICLSRLTSNDTFEYSKIGTWSELEGQITAQINGKGIYLILNTDTSCINIYETKAENGLEELQLKAIKNLPFNPNDF